MRGFIFSLILTSVVGLHSASADNPASTDHSKFWYENPISVMEEPSRMPTYLQAECAEKILNYTNQVFGTQFDITNIADIQLPGWAAPEIGFIRGGAYNIRVVGNDGERKTGKRLHKGRFMPRIGWVELGAHAALHLPGKIDGYQTFFRRKGPKGAPDQVDFVAHIDSALPYEPVGALIHLFRDVIGASGRNPCPGGESGTF